MPALHNALIDYMGDSVTYQKGAASSTVTAKVSWPNSLESDLPGSSPVVFVRLSDVPTPVKGDKFVINSKTFTVVRVIEDGYGAVRCICNG